MENGLNELGDNLNWDTCSPPAFRFGVDLTRIVELPTMCRRELDRESHQCVDFSDVGSCTRRCLSLWELSSSAKKRRNNPTGSEIPVSGTRCERLLLPEYCTIVWFGFVFLLCGGGI